ncbi:GntR family transcriptional regulator [Winogradskya consettensis]|uniref:GntR family transcriptional regulator n=1 Tax=Winogradskya consettensis TaxID=113560 RepID=A0A919SLB2_9ACTN|nr:GntR family transcriptional regulator [Actinoplanes consettensis]GIM74865.1 GntR family transcriptional regulator [Actinoplanes consettensis]
MIADDLTAKIRAGELAPGAMLPPQKELSSRYGVTLVTLRQALQRLEDEGLVSQEPGRGTFVTSPRLMYRLDSLRGLAEDLKAQGQSVTTLIVAQALHRPPAWAATQLDVPATRRVLSLERLRLLSGRPAVHQLSWAPQPPGVPLADLDYSGASLYAVLAEHGIVVHRAAEVLRPGILDEKTAALMHQPPGTPVFVSDRVTFGLDNRPILLDRATILGTMMEIRTERGATGMSMQWSRQSS